MFLQMSSASSTFYFVLSDRLTSSVSGNLHSPHKAHEVTWVWWPEVQVAIVGKVFSRVAAAVLCGCRGMWLPCCLSRGAALAVTLPMWAP